MENNVLPLPLSLCPLPPTDPLPLHALSPWHPPPPLHPFPPTAASATPRILPLRGTPARTHFLVWIVVFILSGAAATAVAVATAELVICSTPFSADCEFAFEPLFCIFDHRNRGILGLNDDFFLNRFLYLFAIKIEVYLC